MSPKRVEAADEDSIGHPRSTQVLFGHDVAEQALLEAYRSGRIPHAFLIGGPQGIGKATLAFRMARFVLAHPDPMTKPVQHAKSLAVAPDNPAAELVRFSNSGTEASSASSSTRALNSSQLNSRLMKCSA